MNPEGKHWAGASGQVVVGRDFGLSGRGFESQHRILDG